MPKYPTPRSSGWFWAKWLTPALGTPEGDEQTPSSKWEVVQVFENSVDKKSREYLGVFVGGQAKAQGIENFRWGPSVKKPSELIDGD